MKAAGSTPAMSAPDLLKFVAMHLAHGRIGTATAYCRPPQRSRCNGGRFACRNGRLLGINGWGLGWALQDFGGHKVIGHDGGTIGQYSFLRVSPEKRFAVAMLTNGGDAIAVYREIVSELFGAGHSPTRARAAAAERSYASSRALHRAVREHPVHDRGRPASRRVALLDGTEKRIGYAAANCRWLSSIARPRYCEPATRSSTACRRCSPISSPSIASCRSACGNYAASTEGLALLRSIVGCTDSSPTPDIAMPWCRTRRGEPVAVARLHTPGAGGGWRSSGRPCCTDPADDLMGRLRWAFAVDLSICPDNYTVDLPAADVILGQRQSVVAIGRVGRSSPI